MTRGNEARGRAHLDQMNRDIPFGLLAPARGIIPHEERHSAHRCVLDDRNLALFVFARLARKDWSDSRRLFARRQLFDDDGEQPLSRLTAWKPAELT